MAYNLLNCERDQSYLMPPSMRDWLSEGHLAWFIVDAVGQMDLREFYTLYRSDGWGAAAYDPGMMVAILLYAYCLGLRSSRRIARALVNANLILSIFANLKLTQSPLMVVSL